jgi:DNA-binding helix-hairpin-helix protein with protein kinase domain
LWHIDGLPAPVEFSDSPRYRGGEADLFTVPGQPLWLAKRWRTPTPVRADKLAAMLAAPPAGNETGVFAWPVGALRDDAGTVCGYVMPWVQHARPIFDVFNPRGRLEHFAGFDYQHLIGVARNLAAAFHALHQAGHVVGDVNESNWLVTPRGLVNAVDTDSFQVKAHGRTFRCLVGKAEYTPPELHSSRFADLDRTPAHDHFGLAVLLFQLLMNGHHPFAGQMLKRGRGKLSNDLSARICAGQWPYARRGALMKPPRHAPPWTVLPPKVQDLFRTCFETGHADPLRRPTAGQWHDVLGTAYRTMSECTIRPRHRYPAEAKACPWCVHALDTGRDVFPEPGMAPPPERPRRKTAPPRAPVRPTTTAPQWAMPTTELRRPPRAVALFHWRTWLMLIVIAVILVRFGSGWFSQLVAQMGVWNVAGVPIEELQRIPSRR